MQSYPFTSQVTYDEQGLPLYDRAVDSAFLRKVFAAYFSDGVFYNPTNALQVVAGTRMQVQVNPGICHIQGAMGIEPNLRTLSLTAAGSQPRIDTVVARLDLSQAVRSIELYVKTGTPAASPSAPSLTRDSTIWELGLANISVGANVGTISQSNITDTRLDTSRCGMVAQTIGSLDTGPFFAQLQQALAENEAEAEQLIQYLQQQIAAVEGDTAWMLKTTYDTKGRGVDVYDYGPHLYKATFDVDGWTGSGSVSQTVPLVPVDGGPPVTSGSTLLACIGTDSTLPAETKDAMAGPAGDIAKAAKALGDNTITVTLDSAPDVDVEIYFSVKQGVEPAVPPLDPVGAGGIYFLGSATGTQSISFDFSSGKYIGYIFEVSAPGTGNTWTWETFRTAQSILQGDIPIIVYMGGQANSGGYVSIASDKQSATLTDFNNYSGSDIVSKCTLSVYGVKN